MARRVEWAPAGEIPSRQLSRDVVTSEAQLDWTVASEGTLEQPERFRPRSRRIDDEWIPPLRGSRDDHGTRWFAPTAAATELDTTRYELAHNGGGTTRMPSSASCVTSTGRGEFVIGSVPDCVFGKAMTSRMFSSPARMATNRSSP